jgi:hypothetical protein
MVVINPPERKLAKRTSVGSNSFMKSHLLDKYSNF